MSDAATPPVGAVDLSLDEVAARLYCQMRGLDPDEEIEVRGTLIGTSTSRPLWTRVAEDMIDLRFMMTAMRRAAEQQQPNGAAVRVDPKKRRN